MKKTISILLMLIAIGIAVGAYFLAKIKIVNPPKIDIQNIVEDHTFSDMHYATLKADSLSAIVRKAYPNIAEVQNANSEVKITLNNTNQLGGDFYNNNDKLLRFKVKDFGFEIKHNKETGTIEAVFLKKNNQVTVPNDVLIRIAQNLFNKPAV